MINKNSLFFFLRFLISFLIIAFLVTRVDLGEVVELIPKIKFHFVLIGLLGFLLDRIIMSYRWDILLRAKGIKIPIFDIIKIYFLSSFWGTFLPSSLAPDFIKVYVASKRNSNTSDVLSSVFVDRVIGLLTLTLLALVAILIVVYSSQTEENLKIVVAILAILLVTLFVVFFDRLPFKKFHNYHHFLKESALWKFSMKFYKSCNDYKSNKIVLMNVLFLSFFNHILFILVTYLLFLSLDMNISILYLFVFVPLVNFLIMIPISLGGLGVQEGAYVYFFSQVGVGVQEALTIALIIRALMIVSTLPGGLIYASDGFQIKKAVM